MRGEYYSDWCQEAADELARLREENEAQAQRVELGCAGHLIVANRCRWHRHTQIPGFRISTVGDYFPDGGARDTIGSGERDYYETMVFALSDDPCAGNEGCGCNEPAEWSELECNRYATAGEAQAGHEAMVHKYAARKGSE